ATVTGVQTCALPISVFFPNQVALLARRKRPASSAPLSNRVFPARLREGNHSASTAARLCPYNSSVQSAELASVSRKYRLACDGQIGRASCRERGWLR